MFWDDSKGEDIFFENCLFLNFYSEENFVINDLILVDVINVFEDKIKLLYKEHICRATEDSVVKVCFYQT